MTSPLRLLVVDDSEDDAFTTARWLKRNGYDVTFERVDSRATMRAALARGGWDVVISDCAMPGFSATGALATLHEMGMDLPFIVMSGTIDEESAVGALRAGAGDFVVKGKFARLGPAIERELREAAARRDHRRADAELAEARAKSAELVERGWRIEQASRMKSEFLANMSHELRTPLNSIIGFAEILASGSVDPTDPMHAEFLGDILTSGRHLLRLINDVLDLSKVEAGKLDFRPEPTTFAKLAAEVTAVVRTTAATKGVRLVVEEGPTLDLFLDPARIKQVLYNYLANAIKFTDAPGVVTLRAVAVGDDAFRIEVIDTGVGIAPADVPRLFVEFQQLEVGAARRHGGTGLGLALVKRLVEAQGGVVGVDSAPGRGSVFFATLPRRVEGGAALPESRIILATRAGAPRVLVVEDDAADQAAIVAALVGAGFEVETAATGAQALLRARTRRFDAVCLDLVLPDMSGLDVLAGLRSEGASAAARVVVVSITAEQALAGIAVDEFITKPFNESQLLAALGRIGVAPKAEAYVLVVDDDPASMRLVHATLAPLGYRVVGCANGADALAAVTNERPQAIILDLLMPVMDGFEFLGHLRASSEHANVPVIVWTSKDVTPAESVRLRASTLAVVLKGDGTRRLVEELGALAPGFSPSPAPAERKG